MDIILSLCCAFKESRGSPPHLSVIQPPSANSLQQRFAFAILHTLVVKMLRRCKRVLDGTRSELGDRSFGGQPRVTRSATRGHSRL